MFAGDLGAALVRSAERHPERFALSAAGERLTYRALLAAAARIATGLEEAGVAPGERVAILSPRTPTAYAAIVAALMAGCTYVPLSTRFPPARNRAMLHAAKARALVVGGDAAVEPLLGPAPEDLAIVRPDADAAMSRAGEAGPSAWAAVSREADARVPAYLLFTSGTTGAPKGVPISHANVAAYLTGVSEIAALQPDDRVLQSVDLTFDLSVHDMFLTWLAGAELHVLPENAAAVTPRVIARAGITACLLVPSTAAAALESGLARPGAMPSLRLSFFCGEALPAGVAAGWAEAAPNSRVVNLYGPTEATVAFSSYEHGRGEVVRHAVLPIGRPLRGQQMALFAPDMTPVAPGELGQVCLAGPQLTAGYWLAPELDAEKFAVVDGVRWYRTGDLGRYDERDGFLFAGRADRQVKVRGFLVELQEIERVIRDIAGRPRVAVVAWPMQAEGSALGTVAFVCGEPLDEKGLRAACRARVGDVLTPDRVHTVDDLPLNANGKVDYKALAAQAEERARPSPEPISPTLNR